MARRNRGRVVDGVLLLNKEAGISSNSALQRVKYLYQAQKAGHGGTLDPFADGLLPILFGEATKFGQYLLGNNKRYLATAKFGAETNTDDTDGEVSKQTTVPDLATVNWSSVLAQFIGKQQQIPPAYSALKINGRRAYDLARQGKSPQMQAREVMVYEFELVSHTHDTATFSIHCGKGTYIRALIRDMARTLASSAHTIALSRTSVGQLSTPNYRYHEIESYSVAALDELLLPIEACVQRLPRLQIPAQKLTFLIHGNDVHIDSPAIDNPERISEQTVVEQGTVSVALYHQTRFLGVGDWQATVGRVYPKRLLRHLAV